MQKKKLKSNIQDPFPTLTVMLKNWVDAGAGDKTLVITATAVQTKALQFREMLLKEENYSKTDAKERNKLNGFKASNTWAKNGVDIKEG